MTTREHTISDYERELQELRAGVLEMAGRVEEMIATAADALGRRDPDLVKQVIDDDRRVNVAEIEIDDLCIKILALRQPMGPDLRFITQALKMVTDLERIGDLAVNLAERARDLSGLDSGPIHPDIQRMSELVGNMVRSAIDAFVARDARAAHQVIDRDDEVDDLYNKVFSDVLDLMRRDGEIQRGIHVQSAAKFLERIGDHATNLAEQVVFMIDGEDVRHPRSTVPADDLDAAD